MSKNKGLSLAESMVSLLVMSVVIAATIPIMSQVSQVRTNVDKNTLKCITSNSVTNPDSSVWYDTSDGTSSIPQNGTTCYAAVLDVLYNRGKALETAKWYADRGTAEQKIMSKQILRASCDEGGEEACDYFINKCWKDGGSDTAHHACDDTSNYLDLTYYMHLNYETTLNKGLPYIKTTLEGQLPKWITNFVNEASFACNNNQLPTGGPDQNLNTNIACNLSDPWLYIKGCNLGIAVACTEAHDNNWNKSCSQIREAWPTAPTDNYKLTYKGAGSPIDAQCSMYSASSAAISGCNSVAISDNAYNCSSSPITDSTNCSDDCYIGYDDKYNRSCTQVLTTWPYVTTGTFHLTSDGAPNANVPVATECTGGSATCESDGIGSVCTDGTIYAGNYNGVDMYTTPRDCPAPPDSIKSYTWNSGETDYQDRRAGFPTLPDSDSLGKRNQYIINRWNETHEENPYVNFLTGQLDDAPYKAAAACQALNDINYLGKSDWYLPSRFELDYLSSKRTLFATNAPFAATNYWASTESSTSSNAFRRNFGAGTYEWTEKYKQSRVRCLRSDLTLSSISVNFSTRKEGSCADPGSTAVGTKCTDAAHNEQIYAGPYNSRYMFTSAKDTDGSRTWNNASTTDYWTNANSDASGLYNQNILKNRTDSASPYLAAKACEDLNDSMYLGYNDWYLPSYNELAYLCYRRVAIGYFYGTHYWSSTEGTNEYAKWRYFKDCSYGSSHKELTRRVRCIRSEAY